MITQGILDWLSVLLAGLVDLIPPLPSEMQEALDWIGTGSQTIADFVAPLGIVVPFDAINAIVSVWIACLVFWGGAMFVKAIMWLVGR